MRAYLIEKSNESSPTGFGQLRLGDTAGYNEKWLQRVLFAQPDLLPTEDMGGSADAIVPVCEELILTTGSSSRRLDILGVTREGRLVVIECKLWRNPQAQREVVGQILEYASLLRHLSYSGLQARLKAQKGMEGPNPLYEHVKRHAPAIDQSRFVDNVERSLRQGDFLLIVAGDGIHTNVEAVAAQLRQSSGLLSRLFLVEVRLWSAGDERVFAVPSIVLKTEVIQQRVVVSADGTPLQVQEVSPDGEDASGPPIADEQRAANKEFWNRFIDASTKKWDYPDQLPARHGGNNWVKVPLPSPASPMTVYRYQGSQIGAYFVVLGDAGDVLGEEWTSEQDALSDELGLPFRIKVGNGRTEVSVSQAMEIKKATEADQLQWLTSATNAMINTFRPRLGRWAASNEEAQRRE